MTADQWLSGSSLSVRQAPGPARTRPDPPPWPLPTRYGCADPDPIGISDTDLASPFTERAGYRGVDMAVRRGTFGDARGTVRGRTISGRLTKGRSLLDCRKLGGPHAGVVQWRPSWAGWIVETVAPSPLRSRQMVGVSMFLLNPMAWWTYPSSTFFARFRGLMGFSGSLPAPGETEDHGGASATSSTTHRSPTDPRRTARVFRFPATQRPISGGPTA